MRMIGLVSLLLIACGQTQDLGHSCRTANVCNGACVDTNSDPSNCGSCGITCMGQNPVCAYGQCTNVCPAPTTNCNGACVNFVYDDGHCGSCGNACTGDTSCENGSCTPCAAGTVFCGATNFGPAYCSTLVDDPINCGRCGNHCLQQQRCVDGACK
jgi:hypothetical protein